VTNFYRVGIVSPTKSLQANKVNEKYNNERCRKEGEEMDSGETRQGMGRQGQMEISL
jgi:hypothetical protein